MEKYVCVVAIFLAFCTTGQQQTIDPNILGGIFGTPPPNPEVGSRNQNPTPTDDLSSIFGTPPTTVKYEEISVRPTEGPVTGVDANGDTCKCVPYYLCVNNQSIANDPDITGFGELDIRFGEDKTCQESVEICCNSPKDESERPQPDPSKLRGCGYRNPNGVGVKLAGGNGNEAEYAEFPWVAAIMDAAKGNQYLGVGVIIHPQVIMTGAHIAQKSQKIRIRAGEWDTQTIKEMFPHQERLVQEIYSHRDFGKLLVNDMALLRLESPLELGEHVNMLCLPSQDESFDNSRKCISNGWGKDKFGLKGRYAVIMKKVEQDVVPYARCNSLLKKTRLGAKFNLPQTLLCAGGEAGKDTCEGDGGGPLACPIGDDRYKLAGLVAWGIDCGKENVPAVFAQVSKFRNWIDNKMNEWNYGTDTYNID